MLTLLKSMVGLNFDIFTFATFPSTSISLTGCNSCLGRLEGGTLSSVLKSEVTFPESTLSVNESFVLI